MDKEELKTEAEEDARLAEFVEWFERGEIEIDEAVVSHIRLARKVVFVTQWLEYMEDREEKPLEGVRPGRMYSWRARQRKAPSLECS